MLTLIKNKIAKNIRLWKNRNKTVEISYSRVQAYLNCPWMYHLIYGLGWRSSPNASMALGLSLHRTLDIYMNPAQQEKSLERLMEIYDEQWVNEGFLNPQETFDTYEKGRKMLESFFEVDKNRSTKVLSTEKEFEWKFDNLHFRGTVDRLDQGEEGGYEIIEYKSNADNWPLTRRNNDLQITFYDLGVSKGLGLTPLRLKFHFLSTNEIFEIHRTDQQKSEAIKLLQDIGGKIRREEFEPNTGYCSRCDFGSRCQYYRPADAGGKAALK